MTAGPREAEPRGAAEIQSPGKVLQQERERRGLSVQQAAEELNLDRWIVEAIEADHFLALGAPVYARGHLRKYAALLDVSADLIVGRYDALSGTPAPPVVTPTTTAHMPRRRKRLFILPALLVLAVIIAGLWWWLESSDSSVVVPASGVVPATQSPEVGVIAPPLPAQSPVEPAPPDKK